MRDVRATGHRQAEACARALANSNAVALYSSPLLRAVETARPIARTLGLTVKCDDALRERMNWTDGSGLTVDDFLAEWHRATTDRDYQPKVGASSRQAGERFEAALRRYADDHPTGPVVCVTHGGVTVDLLRNLIVDNALEALAPNLRDGIPGGAITTVSFLSGAWRVGSVAVRDHIAAADRTG